MPFKAVMRERQHELLKHGKYSDSRYHFNTSFPFKTALSEASVKTNRMATTKWTYHKEWSFASNYLILLEILFQF